MDSGMVVVDVDIIYKSAEGDGNIYTPSPPRDDPFLDASLCVVI